MTHRSQEGTLYIHNALVFKGTEEKNDAGLICTLNVEVKCFLLNLQYFSGASLQLPPLWAPYSSERKGTCYTNHIHSAIHFILHVFASANFYTTFTAIIHTNQQTNPKKPPKLLHDPHRSESSDIPEVLPFYLFFSQIGTSKTFLTPRDFFF